MAERRMFAKQIIDSDAFLDMPLSTQSFYFHLSMRADDDGFLNNAKKIQRMLGCSDDDYKILLAKNFIIPFENGLCVIKHWRIHNYIQKDRYKPTIHTEEAKKITIKNNNVYTMYTGCIQDGDGLDSQVRLGKVRLGKESINSHQQAADDSNIFDDLQQDDSSKKQIPICPHQEIINLFAKHLPMGIQPRIWTEARQTALRTRWREDEKRQNIDWWDKFFAHISKSNFLTGKVTDRDGRSFEISLDFIIKSANFAKIIEGKYDNKAVSNG